jgi:hypothetical protein
MVKKSDIFNYVLLILKDVRNMLEDKTEYHYLERFL